MNITFKHLRTHQDLRQYYYLLNEASDNFTRNNVPTFAPDVYGALQRGQAEMVVGYDEGDAKGFFTFYTFQPPLGEASLYVWHGYIRPNVHPEYLKAAFDNVAAVAKENGCTRVVFGTVRKGWERVITKHGFKLDSVLYAKDV